MYFEKGDEPGYSVGSARDGHERRKVRRGDHRNVFEDGRLDRALSVGTEDL